MTTNVSAVQIKQKNVNTNSLYDHAEFTIQNHIY